MRADCRFEDLKNTVDRGSAENFGPDSELCMPRSSDCGSDHLFSVGLGQYFGVFSTNFFSLKSVRKPGIKERSIHAQTESCHFLAHARAEFSSRSRFCFSGKNGTP